MALSGSTSLPGSVSATGSSRALAVVSSLIRPIQLPLRGPNSALTKTSNISEWPRRRTQPVDLKTNTNLKPKQSFDRHSSQLAQSATKNMSLKGEPDCTEKNSDEQDNGQRMAKDGTVDRTDMPRQEQSLSKWGEPDLQEAEVKPNSLLQRLHKLKDDSVGLRNGKAVSSRSPKASTESNRNKSGTSNGSKDVQAELPKKEARKVYELTSGVSTSENKVAVQKRRRTEEKKVTPDASTSVLARATGHLEKEVSHKKGAETPVKNPVLLADKKAKPARSKSAAALPREPIKTKIEQEPVQILTKMPQGDVVEARQSPSKPSGQTKRTQLKEKAGKGQKNTVQGGGGGNGKSGLHQSAGEPDFRKIFTASQKDFWGSLVTIGIFSFVVNLLVLAIPIYLFQISDRVLTSRSIDTLVMLTVVVLGALAIYALLDMMRRYLLMRLAIRIETNLGAPVLSSAISVTQTGSNKDFQSLLDLQQLRNFITGSVMVTFFDALVAPVYFFVVFLVHPDLGMIILASSFILLVVAIINQKITAVPFALAGGFNMRANMQADAMARNSLLINSMGMVKESVLLWGRETAQSLTAQVSAQDRNIFMAAISKFLRLSTQILMLGWGAKLAIDGELTGGMVIAASIISSRAMAPVVGTIEGWRSFVQARSGYGRIKALLMNSPLNQQRLVLPRVEGRLDVERLLYVPSSTKKVVLNGIGFSLLPGESLAIVGSSGTGKTTLVRMLVGAMAPTAGNIRLDQMDIRNWDRRQLGESIGYLPQDVELFPASIKANIARMREDISDAMIFEAAKIAGVHEMISQLPHGYETQVNIDGSPLSGGEKQRLGLARAFFGSPNLVILDEPNSNLDGPGERALEQALARAREQGITTVTVTQRTSLLKVVDKILMLKEGRVEIFGKRDEVLARLSGQAAKTMTSPKTDKTDPSILGTLKKN